MSLVNYSETLIENKYNKSILVSNLLRIIIFSFIILEIANLIYSVPICANFIIRRQPLFILDYEFLHAIPCVLINSPEAIFRQHHYPYTHTHPVLTY